MKHLIDPTFDTDIKNFVKLFSIITDVYVVYSSFPFIIAKETPNPIFAIDNTKLSPLTVKTQIALLLFKV